MRIEQAFSREDIGRCDQNLQPAGQTLSVLNRNVDADRWRFLGGMRTGTNGDHGQFGGQPSFQFNRKAQGTDCRWISIRIDSS